MTQVELARRVGVSQALISSLERGRKSIEPPLAKSFAEVFGADLSDEVASSDAPDLPAWEAPLLPLKLPLARRHWERRKPSGDMFDCLPLPGRSVLVVAVDIAGHGREAATQAEYLAGWLRGFASALPAAPRIQSCAEALESALLTAKVEASWFLALLSPNGPHAIEYTASSHAFPAPLLTLDDTDITFESSAPFGSPPVRHATLRAPWKLVIASDGLLERLGSGDENEGRKSLLRWQSSTTRGEPLDKRLNVDGVATDDETLLVLEWIDWDLEVDFALAATVDREQAAARIRGYLGAQLAGAAAARFENAIVEAIENAEAHGYPDGLGRVWIRMRNEGGRVRAEIEDCGTWRGAKLQEGLGFTYMRAIASHLDYWRVYPQGMLIALLHAVSEAS